MVEEEINLCAVCFNKRKRGQESKSTFTKQFIKWMQCIKNQSKEANSPPDLDHIADPYGGYIAFIYADGNEIGETFSRIKAPSSYKHFSEKLREATENSIFEALYKSFEEIIKNNQLPKNSNSKPYFPFEILNIGGDDVVVIVPAPFSWKVALTFLEQFEERTKELAKELQKKEEKFTSSCGILIAKAIYPMHYAERLAEGLLKEAKKKAKEEELTRSTICHLYLTTQIASEDAKELLKEFYEREDKGLTLTLRPYTLTEAKSSLDEIANLRSRIPTSQLYKLAQSLERGIYFSYGFYLYQLIRGSVEGKENGFQKKVEELFSTLGCGEPNMLWKRTKDGFATPLYDILELLKIGIRENG